MPDPRDAIERIVAAHRPADREEALDLALAQALVANHPDILYPSCAKAHVTASAVIVELDTRRTLLHFHRRLKRWLQVGGHADGEGEPSLVALREARQETGLPDLALHPPSRAKPLDIDVHVIPRRGKVRQHLHLDFRYLLVTRQSEAIAPAPGESTRFRWLRFDEALALGDALDPALHRLLRKAQAIIHRNPA